MQEIRRPTGRKILRRTPRVEAERKKPPGRRTVIIISLILVFIITASIILSLYFTEWKNLWTPVITVNDETINMDYLIRRMKYFDRTDDVLTMVYEIIPSEMLIRQGAPRYGFEVTPEDVEKILRDIAKGENDTISEIEFESLYRNELNISKLSDAEYREIVRTNTLAALLYVYLVERTPTVAEQIHLYTIILPSYEEAEAVITRIQEGEDFSDLARELSISKETGEQGGDLGWWPKGGGLVANLESVAFSLEVGQISNPILIDDEEGIYAICFVSERQIARDIEEDKLTIVQDRALEEWLDVERGNSIISFGGMDWSEQAQKYVFGSTTMAWINLQLAKE